MEELGDEAVRAAVQDAGIDIADVEIAFCGHVFQGITAGQRTLARAGLGGAPVVNVENACARAHGRRTADAPHVLSDQLRAESVARQIEGARLALTHCQGFVGASAIHIFAA